MFVDPDWIWKPDFDLYNAVGLYKNQVETIDCKLSYDGRITWTLTTDLVFLCNFDLKNFPFDSQTCTAKFGSLREDLFITDFQFGANAALYQLDTLTSPSWKVEGVTTSRTTKSDGYGVTPFLNWSISLSRYSVYYVTTIIMPMTLVSFLSLITLWINDLSSRLSLSIISVLIIVALLWTLSFTQPVTEDVTWLQNFSSMSTFFVVMVCIESTTAAYMTMKKGSPPRWVNYLIVFSTPRKLYKFCTGKMNNSNLNDVEMSNVGAVSALHDDLDANKDAPHSNAGSRLVDDLDGPQWRYDPSGSGSVDQRLLASNQSGSPESRLSIVESEFGRSTWVRGARALDRLSRTVLSSLYFISFVTFLALIPPGYT